VDKSGREVIMEAMERVPDLESSIEFVDPPKGFPAQQLNGYPLKPLTEVLIERRATPHFDPSVVIPDEHLRAILEFAAQAPSGYNFQPWRFILLRDLDSKRRLQSVAYDQKKISEASVVVIALGMKDRPRELGAEIFHEGAVRGAGRLEKVPESLDQALKFLSTQNLETWLNRHVMIAVTTMMLVAETYGWDTAPMEGFDPQGVKREFGIGDDACVVALLAIGRLAGKDKAYGGRLSLKELVYEDSFGRHAEL
jgi:nitroreductase